MEDFSPKGHAHFRFCMGYRLRLKEYLRERDGDLCPQCQQPMQFGRILKPGIPIGHQKVPGKFATFDHIHPTSLGGNVSDITNLRLMCYTCNKRRGNGKNQKRDPNSKKSKKRLAKQIMKRMEKAA